MKLTKILYCFVFITILKLQYTLLYAIDYNLGFGARQRAFSGASVALPDPFSVFHNQAFISDIEKLTVAFDYSQPFMAKGFSNKAAAIILPTATATFAATITQTGIPGFAENDFGFVLQKSLGKNLSAGMQFHYYMLPFPENGKSKQTLIFESGIGYKASKNITIGTHIFNPLNAKIESLYQVTELPMIATLGSTITFSDKLLFVNELAYSSINKFAIKGGVEYQLFNNFYLRGGITTKPVNHSFGIGYIYSFFKIDFSIVSHQILGYTPSLSIILNLVK